MALNTPPSPRTGGTNSEYLRSHLKNAYRSYSVIKRPVSIQDIRRRNASYRRRPYEETVSKTVTITGNSKQANSAINVESKIENRKDEVAHRLPKIERQLTSDSFSKSTRLDKSKVLSRKIVSKPKYRKKFRIIKLPTVLITVALVILLFDTTISLNGWHNNHLAQVQAARLTTIANSAEAKVVKASTAVNPALSTVKPTVSSISSYTVAPTLPRYITIPKLGVKAIVLSVGTNSKGQLETPPNVYDTAWYNKSAAPGQDGAMVIDGHVSSWTADGVFFGLKTLKPGDSIQVERGDGTIYNYSVVETQIYSSEAVNMQSVMSPINPSKPGLNLITCTGDVIPGTNEFNQRIVVYAQQQ